MVPETLCSFCETLPVITHHQRLGRESHCPLCHSLLSTSDEGVIRRLIETSDDTPSQKKRPWWSRWLVGSSMLLAVTGLAVAYHVGTMPPTPTPPKERVASPSPPPAIPTPSLQVIPPNHAPVIIEVARGIAKPAPSDTTLAVKGVPPVYLIAKAKPRLEIVEPNPSPATAGSYLSLTPSESRSVQEMRLFLQGVPEIDIENAGFMKMRPQEARKVLTDRAGQMKEKNKSPDGFIEYLKKVRADLEGLPSRMGKDCVAEPDAAKALAKHSDAFRTAHFRADSRRTSPSSPLPSPSAHVVWDKYSVAIPKYDVVAGIPALSQIIGPEDPELRRVLIANVRTKRSKELSATLARWAIFDADESVRQMATEALAERPKHEYTSVLLSAFQHPWPVIAERAGLAVVVLKRTDLEPQLRTLLGEADPAAPIESELKGKTVYHVREMVRINHHRNCLLCHAPLELERAPRASRGSVDRTEIPFGVVPIPGERMPPSISTLYYAERSTDSVIADARITYLRQDFSTYLPVADAGYWPHEQRYDFLVRTRELTKEEAIRLKQSLSGAYHQAILNALRELNPTAELPQPPALNVDTSRRHYSLASRCQK